MQAVLKTALVVNIMVHRSAIGCYNACNENKLLLAGGESTIQTKGPMPGSILCLFSQEGHPHPSHDPLILWKKAAELLRQKCIIIRVKPDIFWQSEKEFQSSL